ncbi:MAG: helix-turn-helix transcriptional regulator [Leptolyngbyaceae cyanobacterium]
MTHLAKQQPQNLATLPLLLAQSSSPAASKNFLTADYLTVVFATVLDRICPFIGFMLLDPGGNLVHSSPRAQKLCHVMQTTGASDLKETSSSAAVATLPDTVTKVAQCLIESRQLFPEQPIRLLQDESLLGTKARICVRAEWIETDTGQPTCIVITLEDRQAIAYQRALFDAQRYHLTPREMEVWELSLLGRSYAQTAQELFISLNTVKRHMKNIRAKRNLVEG